MRLFFALWPDDGTRAQLSALQQGVKGRKTKCANLHVTLAFLGEQPDSLLPRLQDIIGGLVVPEMELVIDRIAYFKRQRIVWAGMQQVPASLIALQETLCAALTANGIAFDQRDDFKPHITLARNTAPPDATDVAPIVWHARQVSLVQSTAEPAGVSYRVLASQYSNGLGESGGSPRKKT